MRDYLSLKRDYLSLGLQELEFENRSAFPAAGEDGKLYIALDANEAFRWNGAAYVNLAPSIPADPAANVAGLRTLGTGANQAMPGNTTLPGVIVDLFTENGTWTKRAGLKSVFVVVIDSGGGGGSGRRGAAGTSRTGGAGGYGGAMMQVPLLASALPDSVSVTVGAGGLGGAAQTTNSTDGFNGANGSVSRFGCILNGNPNGKVTSAGKGGTTGTSVSGWYGSFPVVPPYGQSSGGNGTNSNGGSSNSSNAEPITGGGGGGGINTSNACGNGGNAGAPAFYGYGVTVPGGATKGANGNQGSLPACLFAGWGGGGGAANDSGPAGAGADGVGYGGGGGGGGASLDGYNSGKGGNGANGIVVVFNYF